ncbi:hypothetical protein MHYP_G00103030 [Metynnis hypsauchen]
MTFIWIIIFILTPEENVLLCLGELKTIPVQSGSAEDQRFSLDDDTAARVFTITITDLRPEDGGTYWCGIQRTNPLPDLYIEILLLVKLDAPPTVSPSTYSPPSVQTQSTPPSSFHLQKLLCVQNIDHSGNELQLSTLSNANAAVTTFTQSTAEPAELSSTVQHLIQSSVELQ